MPTRIGPVMLDLEGLELTVEECELLDHPAVGGVILFSRNYDHPGQLQSLVEAIRAASPQPLLIAVDQEGGRVQRFRDGFTRLPPARAFGQLYVSDPAAARSAAADTAWLLATELREVGVDFSFAPVLDIDHGLSQVIGDRAFADAAEAICDLATAWITGAHSAGMAVCGKHFPGHGGVVEDSHAEFPIDRRPLKALREADLVPFQRLVAAGLDAIMPAHVLYPAVDRHPAGFSAVWLQDILRHEFGFQGVIFSDDLSMTAAEVAGSYTERARLALDAGCDMVILCNNRAAAVAVVDSIGAAQCEIAAVRLRGLRLRPAAEFSPERRDQALHRLGQLG